jgi:two-component system KDP operon response regulator KdpE
MLELSSAYLAPTTQVAAPHDWLPHFGKRAIGLTGTKCIILQKLMKNAGHVVAHSDLVEDMWDEYHPGIMASLRTYIRRLRQKLESDPGNSKLILTKAGIGYYLMKQP